MFYCEFYEVFKNTFFTEHLWTTASVVYVYFILGSFSRSADITLLLALSKYLFSDFTAYAKLLKLPLGNLFWFLRFDLTSNQF